MATEFAVVEVDAVANLDAIKYLGQGVADPYRFGHRVGGSQVGCDDQVVAAMDPDAVFDGGKSRDSDVIDSTVGPADCHLTTSD